MRAIKDGSLYLVISEGCCRGREASFIARCAVKSGVDIVQMREKDRPRTELLRLGKELARICKDGGATFIVNDDPVLAEELGADGVHLGQEDMVEWPVEKARALLGRDKMIGVSTHSYEQFEKANGMDVDYIAFGPIFKTKTKDYFIGTGDVKKVLCASRKPIFFIGGIDLSNVGLLIGMGVRNIAMIRAITEAEDVEAAARKFKETVFV